MATFTSNNSNGYQTLLNATLASQNIANNNSAVNWNWDMYQGNNRFNVGSTTQNVNVNSNVRDGNFALNTTAWGYNQWFTLASGSTTVSHNSDGSKSINCSSSFFQNATSYGPSGTLSASGTMTLPTIPRASSFNGTPNMNVIGLDTSHIVNTTNQGNMYQKFEYLDGSTVLVTKLGNNSSQNTFSFTQSEIESIFDKNNLILRLTSYSNSNHTIQVGSPMTINITVNYEGILKTIVNGIKKLCLPYVIVNGQPKLCIANTIANNTIKRSVE